mmetsp:Transcript_13463/g.30960  ORF Transcript_13463/g.30960 Transcript_13463/m.30960 type:complete len:990 (+) Transcript_13463:59-3028(+)|eukprot:CAMPEP_0114574810 /NCGR_PEP_ID=MMETSP0114-20121206/19600_1 /TAXON_ID=31324 /ORGANISM="Goniomonas sp, Strain m" /LENGTH=989 /DNA_ID=CAMNT_0001762265 /DNA_START=58 /DNA_END=3027 /DNA_ORIENTATION=-
MGLKDMLAKKKAAQAVTVDLDAPPREDSGPQHTVMSPITPHIAPAMAPQTKIARLVLCKPTKEALEMMIRAIDERFQTMGKKFQVTRMKDTPQGWKAWLLAGSPEEFAAMKVQAIQRGRRDRKLIKEMREADPPKPKIKTATFVLRKPGREQLEMTIARSSARMNVDNAVLEVIRIYPSGGKWAAELRVASPQNVAATQIQAMWRGARDREMVRARIKETGFQPAYEPLGTTSFVLTKGSEEVAADAVTRARYLFASQGKVVQVRKKETLQDGRVRVKCVAWHLENVAATRIQALVRGRQARARAALLRDPMACQVGVPVEGPPTGGVEYLLTRSSAPDLKVAIGRSRNIWDEFGRKVLVLHESKTDKGFRACVLAATEEQLRLYHESQYNANPSEDPADIPSATEMNSALKVMEAEQIRMRAIEESDIFHREKDVEDARKALAEAIAEERNRIREQERRFDYNENPEWRHPHDKDVVIKRRTFAVENALKKAEEALAATQHAANNRRLADEAEAAKLKAEAEVWELIEQHRPGALKVRTAKAETRAEEAKERYLRAEAERDGAIALNVPLLSRMAEAERKAGVAVEIKEKFMKLEKLVSELLVRQSMVQAQQRAIQRENGDGDTDDEHSLPRLPLGAVAALKPMPLTRKAHPPGTYARLAKDGHATSLPALNSARRHDPDADSSASTDYRSPHPPHYRTSPGHPYEDTPQSSSSDSPIYTRGRRERYPSDRRRTVAGPYRDEYPDYDRGHRSGGKGWQSERGPRRGDDREEDDGRPKWDSKIQNGPPLRVQKGAQRRYVSQLDESEREYERQQRKNNRNAGRGEGARTNNNRRWGNEHDEDFADHYATPRRERRGGQATHHIPKRSSHRDVEAHDSDPGLRNGHQPDVAAHYRDEHYRQVAARRESSSVAYHSNAPRRHSPQRLRRHSPPRHASVHKASPRRRPYDYDDSSDGGRLDVNGTQLEELEAVVSDALARADRAVLASLPQG